MPKEHFQLSALEGWEEKRANHVSDPRSNGLHQRRFCKMMVETEWSADGFYGRLLRGTAICGHLVHSDMDWHTGGDDDQFPILDTERATEGEVDQESYKFLEEEDVPFSVEAAQQVVRAGARVANNYEDVRHADRQVQEIHMWKMSSLSQNARELLVGDPELGEQIARLREVGAFPYYGGSSLVLAGCQGCRMVNLKPTSW